MKICFLLPALLLLTAGVYAQKGEKGTVRGNVFDKENAQPLGFVSVALEGASVGTTTDVNGFFSLSNVPAGTYKLRANYLGYEEYSAEVAVKAGEILFQNIYLSESGNKIEEVVISGQREQARTEVQVSKLQVTPKQIRSLPSAGGQADIAQYLTVLPGVIFTGDQGGQLYIRGGSPVQNRILLDGMTIYNPFHSIGFFSVFETELIRNVDVLTGGFNAEYGGRISAVVDVNTREGNRKRLSGLVSGSPFQAKALVEGPLVPLKKEGGSSVSFVVTGKKALIDQLDKSVYPRVNNDSLNTGIPFGYQDIYGKVSVLAGNGSKLNLFGFNYSDGVDFPITDFSWGSTGGGLDFTLVPTNSNTIINGIFTFSNYDSKIEEADRLPRNSGIRGYYGGLLFSNFGRNEEWRYGLELTGFRTEFNFINFRNIKIDQNENTTEISSYIKYRRKIGPLVIEPGFRLQYYQTLGEISPEPRLGLKYNLTDFLRLKAAGGLYSQNLLATVNERDIVNLFVGFLSAPDSRVFDREGSKYVSTDSKLQRAQHGVFGVEIDILDNLNVNVEGYYKNFSQLIALNRNKQVPTDPSYVTEKGKAYGIDLSVKYEAKRFYLWGAYSLGKVTRDDGEQVYPPVFDRRHNLNLVATYQMGRNNEWELGARWNFGTGFPFTLTQGFYSNYNFNDGISTDVLNGQPDLGIVYDEKRNSGRLPTYHRLDLSLKRIISFSRTGRIEVVASATNVYDRPNIFYFDRVQFTRVNQLPLLPSLSMTVQF